MVGSNSYEKVKTLKYVGSLFANLYFIYEQTKCGLEAENSCYFSVQTRLSSRFLFKNLTIKRCKIIILPVFLHGCETRSLTLREECTLKIYDDSIHRRVFELKRNKNGEWKRLHSVYLV